MQERLDKFVSTNSEYTRAEVKKAISKGRVTVNGVVCKKPDEKIGAADEVALDGKVLSGCGNVYIMLNKPAGVLSATEDGRCKTVIDLVKESIDFSELAIKTELFPIGRLDKDTEGLLVLTNDGQLAHRLLSPKKHVEKEYYAECEGSLAADAVERFEKGLPVGEEYVALPAKLKVIENEGTACKLLITLTEGKFHQVKRMCHEVGVEVTYLKRIRFGRLSLPKNFEIGEMMLIRGEDL